MPRVVISGYYGFANSGDEVLLQAMLSALHEAVPGLEATVLSRDPERTARETGAESVRRNSLPAVLRTIREADLLISGGGSLLQDVTGPKSIIYYLGIVLLAKMMGKPVFFYAQGFGPVRTAFGKLAVRLVANRVDLITVRDPGSLAEMRALGVTRPPGEVTADPVLGLDPGLVDRARGKEILSFLGAGEGPVAGIAVRPWKSLTGYREVVARAADELVRQGWQVLLVPMHRPGDFECCRDVAARMREGVLFLEPGADFKDVLAVAANLDLALGMRLHFLIFAALFGVPVIGLTYDPKVNRFLQSLGLPPGLDVDGLDGGELRRRISDVIAGRRELRASLLVQAGALRQEALRSAQLAAGLLARRVPGA